MDSMYTNAGVDKNNDAAKHAYYSSNRRDPCGEVLQIKSRQEELESCGREKRPYNKSNTTYWETEIREKRVKTH